MGHTINEDEIEKANTLILAQECLAFVANAHSGTTISPSMSMLVESGPRKIWSLEKESLTITFLELTFRMTNFNMRWSYWDFFFAISGVWHTG